MLFRLLAAALGIFVVFALSACASSLPGQPAALAGTPTLPPLAEFHIAVTQPRLRPGEATELVAAGRSGDRWVEIKAIWRAEPASLGTLDVPPQQTEGLSRTWFVASEPGQVTVSAEPAGFPGPRATATLEIAARPTPLAIEASPGVIVTAASPTPRPIGVGIPRPTPSVVDSTQLRQGIAELDRLDRQVLAAADLYVFNFRAFLDKKATQEQACGYVLGAVPQMQKAVAELKAFAPPSELRWVYAQYVQVAEDLQTGLLALVEFCRTSDLGQIKPYVDLTAGAIAKSALAKQELDVIAAAIGLPPLRSTRGAIPSRTP